MTHKNSVFSLRSRTYSHPHSYHRYFVKYPLVYFLSLFSFLIPFLYYYNVAIAKEDSIRIESFTPQGTIKKISQVTARFSDSVVSFGDPQQKSPFLIQCPILGVERWVDSKNWVFEFEKEISAGIQCQFLLNPQFRSFSGKTIIGEKAYAFFTGGVDVTSISPNDGAQEIEEDTIFAVSVSGDVDLPSVQRNAYFVVEGIAERVGVRILEGKEKDFFLKKKYMHDSNRAQTLLLVSKLRFPPLAKISFVWGKGILSKNQISTESDQVFQYTVRKPFLVEFSCERENVQADCNPISPFVLRFSSPFSASQAKMISLKSSDGSLRSPSISKSSTEEYFYSVFFQGPFQAESKYTIILPNNLKDDFSRPLLNQNKFPLQIKTAKYPPLVKFTGHFGIAELKDNPVLPLTIRNVEKDLLSKQLFVTKSLHASFHFLESLKKLTAKVLRQDPTLGDPLYWIRRAYSHSIEHSIFLPVPPTKQYPTQEPTPPVSGLTEISIPRKNGKESFEVIGIPFQKPGFYVVEVESPILGESLLGKKSSAFISTTVLVTDLSVHFKWGKESSAVWVTSLQTGKPVSNVKLQLRDCESNVLDSGVTNETGIYFTKKNS